MNRSFARRTWICAATLTLALAALGPLGGSTPHAAAGTSANCSQTSAGFTPLTDLGTGTYHGRKGGLYPRGRNKPPHAYRHLGRHRAAMVEPLDRMGHPSSNGKTVLLSVGMSNTLLEWEAFMSAAADVQNLDPHLTLVEGADAGWDAVLIADPAADYWKAIDQTLTDKGLSERQVQVVWLKEAVANETRNFPQDANGLRDLLDDIVAIMKDRYPNLRIVYISSRTYGGYASIPLNPEPYAYESGFAVKWSIAQDIRSARRERPWIAWGPYLWTDGTHGRDDGLVWRCADVFEDDGTHPSTSGQNKVAGLLLDHFSTDPTATPWFLGGGGAAVRAT